MADEAPVRRYRFGVFEADSATGELRRKGVRIKLNAQPFQVLLMLLNRAGELVTREEIARELWGDGRFVDFEHGVNSAVNRIREAVGDAAGSPRFVETLARRGYRFVAPVERIGGAGPPAPPPATDRPGEGAVEARPAGRILATREELPRISPRATQTLFLLFQLMYLGFYIGALANLAEIEDLMSPLPHAGVAMLTTIVTAAVLIPVRAFVLAAVAMRAPRARANFFTLWPALLVLDELWALSPFLLLHHINWGLALACAVLLVYAPFAQRSLALMGAGSTADELEAAR